MTILIYLIAIRFVIAGNYLKFYFCTFVLIFYIENWENALCLCVFFCFNSAGYNYYGNETLYSGINGNELEVQIFVGIVYYQRLRHMVADKFQVCNIL